MDSKLKKIIKYILSLAIAAVFIWLVIRKVDWTGFMDGLQGTRWLWILMFILASLGALVFRALRWRDLLRGLDPNIKLIDVWDSINVGNLANVGLPGAGEFLRCAYVSSKKASYDKSLGTIVMERAWDILAIIVLLVIALSLSWDTLGPFFQDKVIGPLTSSLNFSLWWLIVLLLTIIALTIWIIFHFRNSNRLCSRIAGAISGVTQGLGTFFQMDHKILFASYTVGLWVMYILMSWFGLKAIPELDNLSFMDALFISAIGNLASVIPVPSGMGPYHYLIMVTLSSLYGCTESIGVLYAILCHESHAILIIILGAVCYVTLSIRRGKREELKEK